MGSGIHSASYSTCPRLHSGGAKRSGRDAYHSPLSRISIIMTHDFHNFSQSLRDNFGLTYGSGHDRFLPDPFQFIPYQSSCHLTIKETQLLRPALNTLHWHVLMTIHSLRKKFISKSSSARITQKKSTLKPLRTKHNPSYLKTQFVPRSKHHLDYKHQSLNYVWGKMNCLI